MTVSNRNWRRFEWRSGNIQILLKKKFFAFIRPLAGLHTRVICQLWSKGIETPYSADAIEYLPNVNISCDIEKVQKVFYHKPMCITREF